LGLPAILASLDESAGDIERRVALFAWTQILLVKIDKSGGGHHWIARLRSQNLEIPFSPRSIVSVFCGDPHFDVCIAGAFRIGGLRCMFETGNSEGVLNKLSVFHIRPDNKFERYFSRQLSYQFLQSFPFFAFVQCGIETRLAKTRPM
jgi:hypothetical protein